MKTLIVCGKRLLLSYTAELRRKKRWLHNAIGNAEHPTSHIKYRSRLTVCRRRRDDRALMNIRVVFCVIVCGLVLAFVGRAGGDPSAQSHSQRVFKVGVLASLTGSWSSLGQNTVAALQIAEEQLEAEAISHQGGYRFHFFVRDTELDPSKALEAIKDLDKRGVKIVIGPQSSAEVAMIKPYADAHNILVISQGSTASWLAIAGGQHLSFLPK